MCIEITTNGAFYGMGKTITPSIIGIIFTGLRVPLAMLLFNIELLGINGIWWSISSSSKIKGIFTYNIIYNYGSKTIKKRNSFRILIFK